MCGAITTSGYTPKRYVQPQTLQHALNIILQNKDYIDWTRWNEVKMWAQNYFKDGEPYLSAIRGTEVQLNEMKTIRNRVTHHSEYTVSRFLNLVRDKIGNIPRGITPGKFLNLELPDSEDTVIKYYVNVLLSLGRIIVS